MTHDFRERLDYSHSSSDEPFWNQVYRKAFPNFAGFVCNTSRNEAQYRGVDRLILLGNDTVVRVDEKKREKEWGDILLEYISVDTANKPGWIEQDLAIDYLAYAFMQSQRVYLFPWLLLRRAWQENKSEWGDLAHQKRDGFRNVSAQNSGYVTWSIAVPIDRLFEAIRDSSIIEVALNG